MTSLITFLQSISLAAVTVRNQSSEGVAILKQGHKRQWC